MGLFDKMKDKFPLIEEDEFEEEFENQETEEENRKMEQKSQPSRKYEGVKTSSNQNQVVLVKPETFSEVSSIAEHLVSRKTVVLNLEYVSKEITRRLIDFLSGVAFAMDGQVKKVSNSTYIITPKNVDFVSEMFDEADFESENLF